MITNVMSAIIMVYGLMSFRIEITRSEKLWDVIIKYIMQLERVTYIVLNCKF